jgi:hypothetical protein
MKKREIFIVIALIAFGIIYNAYKTGDIEIGFYEGCSVDSTSLLDKNHLNTFPQEEIRYSHDDVKKIEIENPAGDIIVEKAPEGEYENSIRIIPEIRVYHRNKDQAHKIYKEIKISTRTIDSDTTKKIDKESAGTEQEQTQKKLHIIVAPDEAFPYRRARVQFKLIIPQTVELDLWNRYGDIDIDNCGKNISLNGKYGDIRVRHVNSQVKIRHRYGIAVVEDIRDAVDLTSRYSKIKIEDVAALKLNCSNARMTIEGVKNETEIDNASHSLITMKDSRKVTIDARYTRIKLENINDGVSIKNSHENIYMKNIKGNVRVKARHCKIILEGAVSDMVDIANSYDPIRLEGLSARSVGIMLDNGRLDIAFDRIEESVNIKNTYSRISLEYPPSIQPLFSIHVRHGRIVNQTSIQMAILEERGRVSVKAGTMEGKPQMIIDNSYGDVLLKNSAARTEEKQKDQ